MNGLDNSNTAEQLLRKLGATRKLVGFRYAVYMIKRISEDPDQIFLITKRLYPETGERFGVKATSVERNVRSLIHICWKHGDRELLENVAGRHLEKIPTNSEFLDMAASFLNGQKERKGGD